MKASLLAIAASTLIASSTFAGGANGIVVVQFPLPQESFYVDCLGEYITHDVYVEARDHTITTPSGTVHIVDNWTWTSYDVGVSTGRVWVGRAVSPGPVNFKLGKGTVVHWIVSARFTPLDADSPTMIGKNQFQMITNANGDLVVFHDVDPISEVFRCIGPNA